MLTWITDRLARAAFVAAAIVLYLCNPPGGWADAAYPQGTRVTPVEDLQLKPSSSTLLAVGLPAAVGTATLVVDTKTSTVNNAIRRVRLRAKGGSGTDFVTCACSYFGHAILDAGRGHGYTLMARTDGVDHDKIRLSGTTGSSVTFWCEASSPGMGVEIDIDRGK